MAPMWLPAKSAFEGTIMPKLKLTKRTLDAAEPKSKAYELRDTEVVGLLCKVSPAGRRTFMLQYRNYEGIKRKPALGLYGDLTVEQARTIAQKWLAEVRDGGDPSRARAERRASMTIREFEEVFYQRWTLVRNKKSTQKLHRYIFAKYISKSIGGCKIESTGKKEIQNFVDDLSFAPGMAYISLGILSSMFKRAEEWGYRSEDTNPCKGITTLAKKKRPRLIRQDEMARLMDYLELPEGEGGGRSAYTLAIRLQFAFAARVSEILQLRWEWVDFERRRIDWPDSKTGPMWKPISKEARALLKLAASNAGDSPFVIPNPSNPSCPVSYVTYRRAWQNALTAVGIEHVGTHGIRHRAATDIANSGVPLKVGMALTAHRRVEVFLGYVHLEEPLIYEAADQVAESRMAKLEAARSKEMSET